MEEQHAVNGCENARPIEELGSSPVPITSPKPSTVDILNYIERRHLDTTESSAYEQCKDSHQVLSSTTGESRSEKRRKKGNTEWDDHVREVIDLNYLCKDRKVESPANGITICPYQVDESDDISTTAADDQPAANSTTYEPGRLLAYVLFFLVSSSFQVPLINVMLIFILTVAFILGLHRKRFNEASEVSIESGPLLCESACSLSRCGACACTESGLSKPDELATIHRLSTSHIEQVITCETLEDKDGHIDPQLKNFPNNAEVIVVEDAFDIGDHKQEVVSNDNHESREVQSADLSSSTVHRFHDMYGTKHVVEGEVSRRTEVPIEDGDKSKVSTMLYLALPPPRFSIQQEDQKATSSSAPDAKKLNLVPPIPIYARGNFSPTIQCLPSRPASTFPHVDVELDQASMMFLMPSTGYWYVDLQQFL